MATIRRYASKTFSRKIILHSSATVHDSGHITRSSMIFMFLPCSSFQNEMLAGAVKRATLTKPSAGSCSPRYYFSVWIKRFTELILLFEWALTRLKKLYWKSCVMSILFFRDYSVATPLIPYFLITNCDSWLCPGHLSSYKRGNVETRPIGQRSEKTFGSCATVVPVEQRWWLGHRRRLDRRSFWRRETKNCRKIKSFSCLNCSSWQAQLPKL